MTSDRTIRTAIAALLLALALLGTGFAAQPEQGSGRDGRIPFPKPGSHKGNWLGYHGKAAGAEGNSPGKPGRACIVCHDRTDCIACHTVTAPRDHTNFWRTRGHGLMAGGNRERCLACHRQDYCIRCHSETAPRSHTASWRKRHCTWCHFGSGNTPADNCAVCHKQAAHTSAPHAVSPALDCRACH